MRVGIIAIQHESNTFVSRPTTLADFQRDIFCIGDSMLAQYGGGHHEISGFLEILSEQKIDVVPIFATWAVPAGTITTEAADELVRIMQTELARAGKLDGLLVAPHGAAVAENHRDLDGHWLSLVRQHVGPDVPIVCTLDLHAGVSQKMIDACNATVVYRTNPHLDQRQRGREAASLLASTLRGKIKPTQAASWPPVLINIERQLTATSPAKELYAFADAQLQRPGVLSNSIVMGFPYADVEEMGPAMIVVTDNDPKLAQQLADEMADYVVQHRKDFVPDLIDVERALDLAASSSSPVCLLDIGDNVGGGSPADGTVIAHAMHRRKIAGAFVCFADAPAVQQAINAGIGQQIEMSLGGHTDDRHGPPLNARFTVRSLHDGTFTESQPRHGGKKGYKMGPTAIVESEHGLTIMLTTLRTPPFSLQQLIACGLKPETFNILVAKGVHAPVAAYREVCKTLIRVNTPGVTTADVSQLTYHHRRKPMFPFEEIL